MPMPMFWHALKLDLPSGSASLSRQTPYSMSGGDFTAAW